MDAEPKRPPPPKSYVPLVLLDGPPELPPRPQAEAEDPSPPHPSQGSPVPTPRSSHPSSQGSPVPRPRSHSHSSSSSSPVPRPRVKHPPSVEQTASNSVQSHQETAQASTADAQSSGVRSLQGSAETEPFPVKPIRRKNKRGGTQPVSSIATTPETHSNGDSATTESLPPRSLSPQYDEPLQRRHTMAAARPQLKRYPAPSQPAPPPPREETDSPGPRKKEMPRPPPPYAGRSSTLKKGLESSSPAAAAGGGGRGGKSLGTKAPPPAPAAAATSGGVSRPPPVRPSRPPAVSPPPAGMMTSSPSLRARSATIATTSPKYSREASPKPGARPDITIVSAQPMTGDFVPPPASSLSPQRSAARPPPARLQRKHPDTTSLEATATPSSKEHPKDSALHHRGRPPPPHPGRVNEPAKASPPLPRRPHPQHPVPRPPPPQPKSSPALSKKHEVGPPPEEEPPEPPTEVDIEQHEAEHGVVLSTAPATALTAAAEPKKSKSVSFATLPDTATEEVPEPVKQTRPRPPAPAVAPRPTPSPEPSSTATEDTKVLLHPARPAIVPRATPSPEPDPKTRPAIVPRASVSPELPRKELDPKTRPSVVPRPTPSPELASHGDEPDPKSRPSVVPRPTPSPELASHKEEPDPKTRPSVVPRASRASPDLDTGHHHEETTQASKKQMAPPKRPSMKRPPAPKKKTPDSEPGKSESGVEREGKGEAVNERKQAPKRPTAPSRKHEQPQAVATVEEKAVERKEGDQSAAAKPEKMVKKEPPKRPSMKRPAPPKVTRKEPPSATVSAEEKAPNDTPLLEESEQQVEHKQQPDNELKSTPNSNDDEQKSPSPTEGPTLQQSTSPVEDQSGAEEHKNTATANTPALKPVDLSLSSTEPVQAAAHKTMPKRPPPAKRPPPPSRRATVKQAHTETETKTKTVAKIDSSTVAVKEHVTSTTKAAATPRESVSPTEEHKESPPSASLPQDHNTHPGEATPTKQADPAPSSEPVSKPAPKRPSFRKPPPPKLNLKQETMRTDPTPSEAKTVSTTSPTEATPQSPSDDNSGSPTLEPSSTPSQPKQSPSPSPEVPENTPDQRPASTSPVQPSSSSSAPAKRPSFRKPPPPKTTPSHEVTNASVAMLDATSSEEEEEKEEERKIEEKKAIKKPAAKPPPPKRSSSLNTITPQQPPPDTHKTLETLAEPDKAAEPVAEPDRLAEPDKVVEPEKAPEEPLKQATTSPQPSTAVAGSVVEQASSTPPVKHSPPKKLPPAKRPPPPSKRPTIKKKTTTTTTATTTTEAPEPPAEIASQSASPANAAIDAEKSESKIERKKARPPSMRRPPPPKMGGAKTGAPHTSPATQQKVEKPPSITSPDKQPETQTNMQPEALNETQADKNAGTPEANANVQVVAVAVPASLAEAVEGAKHVQPAGKEEEEGEVASPPGDREQGEEDVKESDSTVPREGEGPPLPGETDQLTDEAGGGGGGEEEEQAEDKPTANSQELSPEGLEGAGLRRTPSGRIKGEASEDSGVRIIRYSTAADTAAGAANVKTRAKKTDRPNPPRPVSMPPPGRPGKPPAPRTAQGKPGRPGPPPKPAPSAAKPAPGRKPPPHKASHKEPSSSGPPSLPPRPEPGHPLYKYVCSEPHGLATVVFEATASDELSYQEGDVIELLEKVDENWYYARNADTGLQDGLILARSMNIIKRLPGQDTVAGFDDGPCAVAMHDFIGQSMDELSFSAGDLIMLKARVDDTWLKGKLVAGGEGIFPKNFVEIVEDLPPEPAKTSPAPTSTREERTEQIRGPHCVAMYAFIAEGSDELSLSVGDVVALVGRKRGGAWLRGSLRGREGIFPSDFVEIKEDLPPGVGEEEEKGNQTAAGKGNQTAAGKGNQTAAGKGNQTTAGKGNQTTAVKVHVVSALHNFSGDAGELSFRSGDKITITARVDDQWLRGECKGQTGTFPAAFVDSVPADLPKSDGKSEKALEKPSGGGGGRCEAVFDFTGEGSDEMTFRKGDTITNLTKVDDDWLRGTLAGKEGIFPSNFVKILDEPLPPPPTKASSPPVPKEPAPSRTVGSKPKQSVDELLPRAEALFDYNAGNSEEISFKEGDMLYLLTKEGPEWYNGEHTQTGAIGQFPVSYVDVIEPLP